MWGDVMGTRCHGDGIIDTFMIPLQKPLKNLDNLQEIAGKSMANVEVLLLNRD